MTAPGIEQADAWYNDSIDYAVILPKSGTEMSVYC